MQYFSLPCIISFSYNYHKGSPYPTSTIPTVATAINFGSFTYNQQVSLLTLAGHLARQSPQLYFLLPGDLWLNDLQNKYNISVDPSLLQASFTDIIERYQSNISGYVLFTNLSDVTAAVDVCAANIALVAISASDESIMAALGIPMHLNASGKDQDWAFQTFL